MIEDEVGNESLMLNKKTSVKNWHWTHIPKRIINKQIFTPKQIKIIIIIKKKRNRTTSNSRMD